MDATKKLKAYIWEDEYAERGYVIYAASAGEARGDVSRCRDIKFTEVRVYRAPWLDKYCGKDIPAKVMLEHEWWIMCPQCNCECALDNDTAVIKNGKAYCIECDAELTFDGELY